MYSATDQDARGLVHGVSRFFRWSSWHRQPTFDEEVTKFAIQQKSILKCQAG